MSSFINDLPAERCQGQGCQFEVLQGKGYAYYGNPEKNTENQMCQADPDAPDKYPDHVHYSRQATVCLFPVPDFLPERPQGKDAQLS